MTPSTPDLAVGLSLVSIKKIEAGEGTPSIPTLVRLAKALKRHPSDPFSVEYCVLRMGPSMISK